MAVKSVKLRRHRIRQRMQNGILMPEGEWEYIVECDASDTENDIDRYFASRTFELPYYDRLYRLASPIISDVKVEAMTFTRIDATHWEVSATAGIETSQARPFKEETPRDQRPMEDQPERQSDFGLRDELEITTQPLAVPLMQAAFFGFWKADQEFIEHPRMLVSKTPSEKIPVTNSLGTPYDPPAEAEQMIVVLRLHYWRRYLGIIGPSGFGPYLNSKRFEIKWPHLNFSLTVDDRYQAKVIFSGYTFVHDADAFRATVEMHIHPDSWLVKLLDQGYEQFDGTDGDFITPNQDRLRTKRILSRSGAPISSPALLNGRGKLAANPLTDWVVGRWLPYGLMDFSKLEF